MNNTFSYVSDFERLQRWAIGLALSCGALLGATVAFTATFLLT